MSGWWGRIKWSLVSFKVWAFLIFILLLILSWLSLIEIDNASKLSAQELFKLGFISKEGVVSIMNTSKTVLFQSALSSLLLFFGTCITAIIAIKGVSYYTNGQQTRAVMDKMHQQDANVDLKKFLPK